MIGIIAKIRVKPEAAEAFKAQAVALTKTVAKKEPGCVFYDLYSTEDPTLFVALELYHSQADVDAHGASDHVAETMKTVPGMLDGDMESAMQVDIITPTSGVREDRQENTAGSDLLGCVVYFDIKPGQEEAFEAAGADMMAGVHANEPGALFYRLFKSSQPGKYVFMERWASQAALDEHMAGPPHVAAVAERFMACVEGDPDMQVYPIVV